MLVKLPKGVSGPIRPARVAVAVEQPDHGPYLVVANISAEDAHGFPSVVASLRLSPAEALALAERLVTEAGKAHKAS